MIWRSSSPPPPPPPRPFSPPFPYLLPCVCVCVDGWVCGCLFPSPFLFFALIQPQRLTGRKTSSYLLTFLLLLSLSLYHFSFLPPSLTPLSPLPAPSPPPPPPPPPLFTFFFFFFKLRVALASGDGDPGTEKPQRPGQHFLQRQVLRVQHTRHLGHVQVIPLHEPRPHSHHAMAALRHLHRRHAQRLCQFGWVGVSAFKPRPSSLPCQRPLSHSEHHFPAPSLEKGCRKPVFGVWSAVLDVLSHCDTCMILVPEGSHLTNLPSLQIKLRAWT